MNTMKNTILKTTGIAIIFALISGLSLSAQTETGQGKGQGQGQKIGQEQGEFCHSLNLTEEQKTQIKTIKEPNMQKHQAVKLDLEEKHIQLKKLETAEKADIKAINAKIDEISAIKTQLMKDAAAVKQEIRALLTPEQRIKFDTHSQKMGKGNKGQGKKSKGQHGQNDHAGNCLHK
jgi:Spy/CpxP family protein refolding chaperone